MIPSSVQRPVNLTHLILEALRLPSSAIPYHVSYQLAEYYPDKVILEGDSHYFDLQKFVEDDHCQIQNLTTVRSSTGYSPTEQTTPVYSHITTQWNAKKHETRREHKNVCFEVIWQEHSLIVLMLSYPQGFFERRYYWILGESKAITEDFFSAVCSWNSEVRDEVMVFEGGQWHKSRDLYESIQSATLDNLILAGSLKEDIYADVEQFFGAREMYAEYDVPWKRGLLFIGPPGNGKTHMVKALVNTTGYPCLYIKSFKTRQSTDTDNMRVAFERVRDTAPCIVVIEDLDALVDDETRSFFLNELDGFALNDGVLMIASTNHPERLDMAILERPSRFDRKYHFDLPDTPERIAYLKLWNQKLQPDMQLSPADLDAIAVAAQGFSFAYLKELLLSSSMSWVQQRIPGNMVKVMAEQLKKLRNQMESQSSEPIQNGARKHAGHSNLENMTSLTAVNQAERNR